MSDQKKIILITEDEPSMLTILQDRLTEAGYQIVSAKNGEEGLQQALEHHPDLILLDVLMPKTDGLTMMDKLRQDVWGEKVPIIMLTNVSPDTNATLGAIVADQPSYYFVKSDTKLDDIVDKIHEILSSLSQTTK